MDIRRLVLFAFVAVMLAAGPVSADIIYSNDFESGVATGFSGVNSVVTTPNPHKFLGILTKGATAYLDLSGVGSHDTVTVSFDLYSLHSMDGAYTEYGPDYFKFDCNGAELLNSTFGPWDEVDQDPHYVAYDPNGFGLGNFYGGAATYHFTFDIADSSPDINLAFIGACNQGWPDEGFGVDNITISTDSRQVPEPATVTLLGLGLLAVGLLALRERNLRRAR